MSSFLGGAVGSALLRSIGFYSRAISPALPPRCRFYPTCSAYAAEAITRHGAARGSWLALGRLLKCAPWHPGGVDLVPDTRPAGHDPHGPGTTAASHSSSTAGTSQPSPADARPDLAPEPLAPPPHRRRAPHEESFVA